MRSEVSGSGYGSVHNSVVPPDPPGTVQAMSRPSRTPRVESRQPSTSKVHSSCKLIIHAGNSSQGSSQPDQSVTPEVHKGITSTCLSSYENAVEGKIYCSNRPITNLPVASAVLREVVLMKGHLPGQCFVLPTESISPHDKETYLTLEKVYETGANPECKISVPVVLQSSPNENPESDTNKFSGMYGVCGNAVHAVESVYRLFEKPDCMGKHVSRDNLDRLREIVVQSTLRRYPSTNWGERKRGEEHYSNECGEGGGASGASDQIQQRMPISRILFSTEDAVEGKFYGIKLCVMRENKTYVEKPRPAVLI